LWRVAYEEALLCPEVLASGRPVLSKVSGGTALDGGALAPLVEAPGRSIFTWEAAFVNPMLSMIG
jgi:hypothetical protein